MEFVSVVCPSFNRHRYIPFLIEQFNNQKYDPTKMELIIFDDTLSPYPFVIEDKRVVYVHDNSKRFMLWEKRNRLNEIAKGDIIVCMDDDDFSFPDRIQHSVNSLSQTTNKLAGCSSIYIYDLLYRQLYFYKATNSKILLNNTYCYKRDLLRTSKYSLTRNNCFEEKTFTKNFTVGSIMLNEDKTIICCSHGVNTVNKDMFCNKNSIVLNSDLEYNLRTIFDVTPILYWINLDSSKDRYNNMIQQLGKFQYNVRVRAVSEPCIKNYNTSVYSKQQISCLCSHLKAMRVSLQDKYRTYAVICEDDIDLREMKNFHEIMFYYVKSAPSNWDVLQLYTIQSKHTQVNTNNMLKWEKWNRTKFSTLIYIINKSYIRKMISCASQISTKSKQLAADEFIYNKGNTYTITIPYFKDDLSFNSLINSNNYELHRSNKEYLEEQSKSIKKIYPFE